MADAMGSDRAHRASGELGYHVVDVMDSLLEASKDGAARTIASTCLLPAPWPEADRLIQQ
jgi:hypothetical protein